VEVEATPRVVGAGTATACGEVRGGLGLGSRPRALGLPARFLGVEGEGGPAFGGAETGQEGEGGLGSALLGEQATVMEDQQTAIEQFAQFDAAAGVGAAVRAGGDLDPAAGDGGGVVAGDDSLVATSEDAVEVTGRSAPRPLGIAGGNGKAAMEVGDEGGQEGQGGSMRPLAWGLSAAM
jgi:hypothetical protein